MFSETSIWKSISEYIKTASFQYIISNFCICNGTDCLYERPSYVCLDTTQNLVCMCACIFTL